jgi:hypothetical protein
VGVAVVGPRLGDVHAGGGRVRDGVLHGAPAWLVFFGSFRGTHEQEHHVHESPRSMTVPLMVLAVLRSWAGGSRSCSGGEDARALARAGSERRRSASRRGR